MPFADPGKHLEAVRRYRRKMADDPAFLKQEAERKARWYEGNRDRKNENQRRWRQEKREQLLRDVGRSGRTTE